jgi:hypothetical protein
MSERWPKFEPPMAENSENQEPLKGRPEEAVERKELTHEEEVRLAVIAIESIGGQKSEEEINFENLEAKIEESILEGVQGLPEALGEKLKTVDSAALNERAMELLSQLSQEQNPQKLAKLQTELIYQYIGIISRVQNGGDKGFIPSVAKEVEGMDCSFSAWALKEKLQSAGVQNMQFEFGYLPGHSVGVIKVADSRRLYVDAQNGFVQEIELEQVTDPNNPDTAYPIFEVKTSKRIAGHLPNEGEVTRTCSEGSDYVPKYLGVREDGLLHSLGNMHMLANPGSPTFYTESARRFREGIGMPEPEPALYEAGKKTVERWQAAGVIDADWDKYFREEMGEKLPQAVEYHQQWSKYWEKFNQLVDKIARGKTIHDTKFGELEEQHHAKYQEAQRKVADQRNTRPHGFYETFRKIHY